MVDYKIVNRKREILQMQIDNILREIYINVQNKTINSDIFLNLNSKYLRLQRQLDALN